MPTKKMETPARIAVEDCLGVKPGEKFLVITDTEKEEIAKALFTAGLQRGAEAMLVVMKPRTRHGEEPPKPIAGIWKEADVFIAPTKFSLSHTQARKQATEAGVRGVTMPGITSEMFLETLSADYQKITSFNSKLKKILSNKKTIRIVTEMGTDITLRIDGRTIITDDGIIHERGAFGNLPAGEVFVAPLEGTANGTVIVDGSIASIGILEEPITITVKDGFADEIIGGAEANTLSRILASVGKKEAYNIAELGIGTNPMAKIVGNILEDEKAYKTVHIALGDNSTIGGKTKAGVHLDCLITQPTVIADDTTVMKNGEWVV